MDAGYTGLGAKVYDSYPAGKMFSELSVIGILMSVFIVIGVLWGGNRIIGTSVWAISLIVSIIGIPLALARILVEGQSRFRIFERGVRLHTFRYDGDLSVVYSNNPYIDWRSFRFEEVLGIHPFLFTNGSLLTTDLGLRFILPHPVHGKVVGDIGYGAWRIKSMPQAVDALKARMGPLWHSKYRPEEPASLGLLHNEDVARFVENGLTKEELAAAVLSAKNVRKMFNDGN